MAEVRFSLASYRRWRFFVGSLIRGYFGLRVEFAERVPAEGPLIMAANHSSYLDPLLLGVAAPRPVHFMMLRDYYEKPVIGHYSRLLGAFPVDAGRITPGTLRRSREVLDAGDVLGIFPEGGRSRDGSLRRGRPGAMLLAVQAGVPVVPVALIGPWSAWPAGKLPRPRRRVTARFGEPITEHLSGQPGLERERAEEGTALLMRRLAELLKD